MKSYFSVVTILVCTLLLVGCISHEKLKSKYVSKEQGKVEIYVIYSDSDQMNSSPMNEKVMSILIHHSEKVVNITSMYHNADIKKVFDIMEIPTILVFDTEGLVLKTTDSNELEELLSN